MERGNAKLSSLKEWQKAIDESDLPWKCFNATLKSLIRDGVALMRAFRAHSCHI